MRNANIIVLFFLMLVWISGARAAVQTGEADGSFLKGNQYYQDGDYEAAISEYNNILAAGYESWAIYYNLGNAYYKQGKLGLAILNYERARRFDPENEDVIYNLELANLTKVDKIQQLPRFFLSAWVHRISHAMSLRLLGYLTCGLYLTLMLLLLMRTLDRRARSIRALFIALVANGVVLALFAVSFALRVYENETTVEAIVLAQKVDVKSAPDAAGTDVFSLHEGAMIRVKDRSLSWVKIQLADGKVGWLQSEAVEII